MTSKILFLTLVAVFLILIPQEAQATNDGDLTYSANISLTNGTGRQPNLNYPTEIIARDEIDFPLSSSAHEGMIEWQTSPDNSTWTTRAWNHRASDIGGLLETIESDEGKTHTFTVPKGQYYRFLATTTSGSPNYQILSIYEIEQDVFEQDPIPLPTCTTNAKPSETIYCMFTAYYQNNTPRNDLTYNVTVQNQSFTTILNTTATNRGSFGEYVFNFTSQSNAQTYYVRAYNSSVNYAKTIVVSTQFFGLIDSQNDTLYGIVGNVTTNTTATMNASEFDINASINSTGNNIMINTTAEGNLTRTNVTSQFNTLTASFNVLDNYIRIAKQLILDMWSNTYAPDRQLTMFNQSIVNFN